MPMKSGMNPIYGATGIVTVKSVNNPILNCLQLLTKLLIESTRKHWLSVRGLPPTGFNDGINAIDDRLYLETLYAQGLRDVSDAIGIHAPGWANPPDAQCCEASEGVETHFESPVFYFLENIEAYRSIMVANGDADAVMWVTNIWMGYQ